MSAASGRRALVTGGAGFIGSTLVDRLLADGWEVVALDAFDPYYPREVKLRNLDFALAQAGFRLVEVDTRNRMALQAAVEDARPQVVFDLAARAGVRPSMADPETYVAINVVGLQNTLSTAAKAGARVVFASSSSVYGADAPRPFREDQALGEPLSPYGATKVGAEALCGAHHAAHGLPVGIARLFTVYGPRQRPDLAIHAFASRMLRGEPVDLYDRGEGVRDYTYVDDAVDALVRLADLPREMAVVNVGSDHPIRTTEVVDELERALGTPAVRRLLPPQPGDAPGTHADISRAAELLGWRPQTPFREGIDRFCRWLRSESGAADATADVAVS
jgi:UDP-glucuronate 4-epimerase